MDTCPSLPPQLTSPLAPEKDAENMIALAHWRNCKPCSGRSDTYPATVSPPCGDSGIYALQQRRVWPDAQLRRLLTNARMAIIRSRRRLPLHSSLTQKEGLLDSATPTTRQETSEDIRRQGTLLASPIANIRVAGLQQHIIARTPCHLKMYVHAMKIDTSTIESSNTAIPNNTMACTVRFSISA